ncbi:magnesium chelatase subunit D family protein [Rhodococcus sp. X156]|uniref:magnesium chelatase subunit D family protein n=1 Tax=Rhodococcus sp. X156 TaxID=2499145 RepID=UPI000FD7D34C|nr:magnesium chelatase subunit D family protein [Rhodococcus sp. X156]
MPQHQPFVYPFSALVGSEDLQDLPDLALALVLSAVSPEIGGVLVRGEKGTAKSTAVRALAGVLPPIDVWAGDRFSADPHDPAAASPDGPGGTVQSRPVRLVELPVGATEDRLVGSLHLERALAQGRAEYEPGLLARAHRGILYVDEVNLLHDHLVDLLLDAAATGRATVERDGVSLAHDARFVLVGTMNPEEGELRPQLLDRFGLAVDVAAPREAEARVAVVRRRLAFDADPAGFAASYQPAEDALRERIHTARERIHGVTLTDSALLAIAEVCAAFDVDGLRGDIVTARTAVAHAAWCGRSAVTREDIRAAARLALPHRRRRTPFDSPGLDTDQLDQLLAESDPEPDPPTPDGPGDGHEAADDGPAQAPPDSHDADTEAPAGAAPSTASAGTPYRSRLFAVAGTGTGAAGRRSRALTSSGRRVGRRAGSDGPLDLLGTVLAAVPHQGARGRTDGRLRLQPADLRVAVREGRESNLVLFCVDASGSMAARKRMEQVKTAILSLLLDAYQRRDKVGLITFSGTGAQLLLPPTGSTDVAAARLQTMPAGGRTPLAEGLLEAARVLDIEARRDPARRPLLVVVTDGRATAGAGAVARSRTAADRLAARGVASVVVDCESGALRLGLAAVLAQHLRAEHVPVSQVSADVLTGLARTAA